MSTDNPYAAPQTKCNHVNWGNRFCVIGMYTCVILMFVWVGLILTATPEDVFGLGAYGALLGLISTSIPMIFFVLGYEYENNLPVQGTD